MRTMKIIKMRRDATIEECLNVHLPLIDEALAEDDERPSWEPQDAEAVDKLIAAQVMRANHYEMLERQARLNKQDARNRIQRIVNAYQDQLSCAMPAEGKKRGSWEGPFSGGKYTGQRDRLPVLAISDRAKAAETGMLTTRTSIVLDTAAVRSSGLSDSELAARGIAVTQQSDVQFKEAK